MIYTVTFNPAVDYVVHTDNIIEGATNRTVSEELFFGGKGINVSYVLSQLGVKSVTLGFIAGFTGDALEEFLKNNGIFCDFVKLKEGLTRINIKIKNKTETEINAQGPNISEADISELLKKLDKLQENDTLILAGSIPKTLPNDIYERIMSELSCKGIRFVVDATGDLLVNTLKYHPFLIKPNCSELSDIFNVEIDSDEKIVFYAQKLKEMGALNVLVSLGEKGAILLDEHGNVHKENAHNIELVNSVGAGDSMVAGFISGCEVSYEYALQLGLAAGAATASLSGLGDRETIFNFIKKKM